MNTTASGSAGGFRFSVVSLAHEPPVRSVLKCAPRREAAVFAIELIGEIDIGFAVEQVAKIEARSFEVHGVDLEITPVECAVRVVVVDLTFALRIFGALDGERETAIGSEFAAGVLLPGGKAMSLLIGLGFRSAAGNDALRHDKGRLETQAHGRLETKCVVAVEPPTDDHHAEPGE